MIAPEGATAKERHLPPNALRHAPRLLEGYALPPAASGRKAVRERLAHALLSIADDHSRDVEALKAAVFEEMRRLH